MANITAGLKPDAAFLETRNQFDPPVTKNPPFLVIFSSFIPAVLSLVTFLVVTIEKEKKKKEKLLADSRAWKWRLANQRRCDGRWNAATSLFFSANRRRRCRRRSPKARRGFHQPSSFWPAQRLFLSSFLLLLLLTFHSTSKSFSFQFQFVGSRLGPHFLPPDWSLSRWEPTRAVKECWNCFSGVCHSLKKETNKKQINPKDK